MADVVVELQDTLRGDLKEPMGAVYTDAAALLADAGEPIVSVGDVVTYHLLEAGHVPTAALVDERTERSAVDPEIAAGIGGFDRTVAVDNPAATLTAALLEALAEAVAGGATTLLEVDGEEDLAALPALLLAPEGGSVVYGQPGEGMVLVRVDEAARDRARDVLGRMDGDPARLFDLLGRD